MKNFRLFLVMLAMGILLWTAVFVTTHCTMIRCYP